MSATSTEGRKSGLCQYAASPDATVRDAFGALPPSIQAIVKRYASEEVLSATQLHHLASVSATNRCEALQMLYKGAPVAEVIYFLLLSSTPSSTRASTETVPAKAGAVELTSPTSAMATTASAADFATVNKENRATTAAVPCADLRKAGAQGASHTHNASLRARPSANVTVAPAKVVTAAAPSRVLTATNSGGRGESVSTFITVSPISSEEDEDVHSPPEAPIDTHRQAAAGAMTPASDASPGEISRGLSYGSVHLPATVSSRRRPPRDSEVNACTPRTVTAPAASVSPAPVSIVIPNLALHKVVGTAAAHAGTTATTTTTTAAATDAITVERAAERATSPSLRPPPNATRIVQYVEANHTTAPTTTTTTNTTNTTATTPLELGSDPRAQALLDLYRRNVLRNEMELEKAYTELSYQRSSVSPCAPPPGGLDWNAFLAHVRQKVRAAERQPVLDGAPRAGAVYAVKRTSGGALLGSPREGPAPAGRLSRGTEKTLTPRGTPRSSAAAGPLAGTATPNSSGGAGSPRLRRRVTTPAEGAAQPLTRTMSANGARPRPRLATAATAAPPPPQKPCAAWDAARGVYVTHPNKITADPFATARRPATCVEPAPHLQPTPRTKGGKARARHPFGRSQTAVANVPMTLRRPHTRPCAPAPPTDHLTAPGQTFQRAATATAAFTRTPSAPCAFTRTASTAAPFARLHSTSFYAGFLTSPRPHSARIAAARAAPPREPAQEAPARLQRMPSRWERRLDAAETKPTPRHAATTPTTATRTHPRPARPRAASAAVTKRRPITPRAEARAAAAAATAATTPAATTDVFKRLTSNFYPCTSTTYSNNNYGWRSGFGLTSARSGAAQVSARAVDTNVSATSAAAAATTARAHVLERTTSQSALCTDPEPTADLCSPRPTSLHHTPQQSSRPAVSSTSTRLAARGTTAAMVSPMSTPRSASYRKPAPIIEVGKKRTMPLRTYGGPHVSAANTSASLVA